MKLASSFLTGSLLFAWKEQSLFAAASATTIASTSSATNSSWAHLDSESSSYFSASNYTPPDDINLFEDYFSEEDEFIPPFDEPNVLTASDMLLSDEEKEVRDTSPRKLSAATAAIGDFYALDCNANLATVTCTNLEINGNIAGKLDIGCGECKIWNSSQDVVTIGEGINILGRLLFPTNHKVTIRTKYVIVQGELEITSNRDIGPENESVVFNITGTVDVLFTNAMTSAPNTNVCPNGSCNLGPKPFVVLGGKLNIRGFPDNCKTWTPIKNVELKVPTPDLANFDQYEEFPGSDTCPLTGTTFYQSDFSTGIAGNPEWFARGGTLSIVDGILTVSDRTDLEHGPGLDITNSLSCLEPNRDYLFTVTMRFDNVERNGKPSWCQTGENSGGDWWFYCTEIWIRTDPRANEGLEWVTTDHRSADYGEWMTYTGIIRFSPENLNVSTATLQFRRLEPDSDYSIKDFSISLPSQESYYSRPDVCDQLVRNGDAESNGLNPYPFSSVYWQSNLEVLEENGNHYFHLSNRTVSDWSATSVDIHLDCMKDAGVEYEFSAKVRLFSEFNHKVTFILRLQTSTGNWHHPSVARCPPQKYSDGFVICRGTFIVDENMADATEMQLRFYDNSQEGNRYDIDIDDVSINRKRGFVDKIIVSQSDVTCWANGATVEFGSSVYHSAWWQKLLKNTFTAEITTSTVIGNGDLALQLSKAPTIPILSQVDSITQAARIALVSRNVKIGGDLDEWDANRGAYLQVLHTINQVQHLSGVEFKYMGRFAQDDRFPIQIQYSGDITGSIVSKNSIYKSKQRCIVIDGSANITLSENVATDYTGQCYYFNHNATDNSILNNYASYGYGRQDGLEGDYQGIGFRQINGPNTFDGNVAVGNDRNGFKLSQAYSLKREDGSDANIDARLKQYGVFNNNIAAGNGHSGFIFESNIQSERVAFHNLLAYNNRYYGLYFYDVRRVSVENSEFIGNGYGISMRRSDEMEVHNTIVRGITSARKEDLKLAMYNFPCISSGWPAPVGFRMNNWIRRFDGSDVDLETAPNLGVKMTNVQFLHFDHDDECFSSVAVGFRAAQLNDPDVDDGHFNYVSSFENVELGSKTIDIVSAKLGGLQDIVIIDPNGSSDPAGASNSASVFISDRGELKTFLSSSDCTSYNEFGMAYCKNACLRGVTLLVDQMETKDLDMKITRKTDGKSTYGLQFYEFDEPEFFNNTIYDKNARKFSIPLPTGQYSIQFESNGEPVWPRYVSERWEGIPNCSNHANGPDISLVEPPLLEDECNQLVRNHDMELGMRFWQHPDWRGNGGGYFELLENEGLNNSSALKFARRSSSGDGIGQNLDTRCFHSNLDEYFEISVWYKSLTINGQHVCDPFDNSDLNRCPIATLKSANYADETKEQKDWSYETVAKTVVPVSTNGYSLTHGVVKVNQKRSELIRAWIYLQHVHNSYDMLIDSFTMDKLQKMCNEDNFIRNGDFTSGYSKYWRSWPDWDWQNVHYSIVTHGNGDNAIEISSKQNADRGLEQLLYIDTDCIEKGDRFIVQADFQMISKEGNSIYVRCHSDHPLASCGNIRISSSVVSNAVLFADNSWADWNKYAGIYTATGEEDDSMSLVLGRGSHENARIIFDNVRMQKLPFNCDNMLQNGDFEFGNSSFWRQYRGEEQFEMAVDSNNGEYSLHYKHHPNGPIWNYVYQDLDTRCFAEGQRFGITAQFKMMDDITNEPFDCDASSNCPYVFLRGEGCNGNEETIALRLMNEHELDANVGWVADEFNPYYHEFIVEADVASCTSISVGLGRYTPYGKSVLIDEISFGHLSTLSPTATPTFHPTTAAPVVTTSAPVMASALPSSNTELQCPSEGSTIEVTEQSFRIQQSSSNTVCTLTKITEVNGEIIRTIPLARSYDGYPWERSGSNEAQKYFSKEIECYDSNYCQINLPAVSAGESYRLSTYEYSVSADVELARFLETATYGVKRQELSSLTNAVSSNTGWNTFDAIVDWFKDQIDENITPATSHRKFWRERVNERIPTSQRAGIPDHPCDQFARFRRFSFVNNERMWYLPRKEIKVEGTGPYNIYYNDEFRTRVDDITWPDGFTFNQNYEVCNQGIGESVNGGFHIQLNDGTCVNIGNPGINLDGAESLATYIVDIDVSNLEATDFIATTEGQMLMLKSALSSQVCNNIPDVPEMEDQLIFGRVSDGTWLVFDSRLTFDDNDILSPMSDGGKGNQVAGGIQCSNVARNFLNEDTCQVSTNACRPASTSSAVSVTLDATTISELNTLVPVRYTYEIQGVSVVDMNSMTLFPERLPHPCTPNLRSRWEPISSTTCENPTELQDETSDALTTLLLSSGDENPYITDIYFPESGMMCNSTDTETEIEIDVLNVDDGTTTCYKRVHPDYKSVYELSYWVENHPGGSHAITKWSADNGTTLVFPNLSTTRPHPMSRWEENKQKFAYVGRFGDRIFVPRDLPYELRTEEVTNYYNPPNENDNAVLVCGSYNEVANVKSNEFTFGINDDYEYTIPGASPNGEDKVNVWYAMALEAEDQLRQRIAWSLAQILVVVTDAVGGGVRYSEWFLSYYDIFVRNAFTNYRQILKEISFSPLMAEHLSFLGSRSSAFLWEEYEIKSQADENYAREIMQLFTIGLNKLNIDGTLLLGEDGNPQLSYTNDDIESLARAWTGFDLQPTRSNIEAAVPSRGNRLDPMRIIAEWRDRFPKTDTTGGYIGDRYVKCEDLPSKAYLYKGAKFRFLGSKPLPELSTDPSAYETLDSVARLILPNTSPLRENLCNADGQGNCRYETTVILDASITNCGNGPECDPNMDTVRVVQVAEGAYFEYVPEPCVHITFYNNPMKIMPRVRSMRAMCANPNLAEASEACCTQFSLNADRNKKYDGERMFYGTAGARCSAMSSITCDFNQVNGDYRLNDMFFWSKDSCNLLLKIAKNGNIAIVHDIFDSSNIVSHVEESNENFFRVQWTTEYGSWPLASNTCGSCAVVEGDKCLCTSRIIQQQVFNTIPTDKKELEVLQIGAPNPTVYDPQSYTILVNAESGITTYRKGDNIDKDTVFEFVDEKGRHFFLRNILELVQVRGTGGQTTSSAFRNPPHFMSLVPSNTNLRDAQYETDATLDHYFYHDNTPPFLASRFIQRLVSQSNPTPRYIESVSKAFISGSYMVNTSSDQHTFGSGEYGSMKAFFAAIYLDREARSVVLDKDPASGSLREPLLKVMAVLRSMEFQTPRPKLRMGSLTSIIGQRSHSFESVFSFFLPEFEPSGPVGEARLTSPEATLLDMPKMVGILNGLLSLVTYGLTNCNSGFGAHHVWSCRTYSSSAYGELTYGKSEIIDFISETFEGPSLAGGLDNVWVGREFDCYKGNIVEDPTNSNNHVFQPVDWNGYIYSPRILRSSAHIVHYRFYATVHNTGSYIGYTDYDLDPNVVGVTLSFHHNHGTIATNTWISGQFEIPDSVAAFRIVMGDRNSAENTIGYFDDVYVSSSTIFVYPQQIGQTSHSANVVDDLANLLTAGRLSADHRAIIVEAYNKAGSAEDGLKVAQRLILTSSEFHSTNLYNPSSVQRPGVEFPQSTGKPYRAIVFMMWSGGCDSFNMVAPHTCESKDLYEEYLQVRAGVALPKSSLLPIDVQGQVCSRFGIHPDLPAVRDLYNDEDLLFFANTGVMSQPVTKENYSVLTNVQLFAHNHMQRESKRIDPLDVNSGTGVLGRMTDVLNSLGHNVGAFSVDKYSVALVGTPGLSDSPAIVNRNGVPDAYLYDVENILPNLHNKTLSQSPVFSETWSDALIKSLSTNKVLKGELDQVTLSTTFGSSYLSRQLETVAKLIKTRSSRGADVDVFYVEIGGFDLHSNIEENLSYRFLEVNEALSAFPAALKELNVWDNTVTIQTSDFARTLNPNGGYGTDHAWGGHYMMFGGSVKGKKMLGTYPDNLTDEGPLTLHRGRFVPSSPWDAVFQGIGKWTGIPQSRMTEVLPNIENFASTPFQFNENDMFANVPPPLPTTSPSRIPSNIPSETPSSAQAEVSEIPSNSPTKLTETPSHGPSSVPSESPSDSSEAPSFGPSSLPSELPSMSSDKPSLSPSSVPSENPTDISEAPSFGPSSLPSELPSMSSDKPSLSPSSVPSENPTDSSEAPSFGPSSLPSELPSMSSDKPSLSPSSVPSESPTDSSEAPSFGPSSLPSELPSMSSDKPSLSPSSVPSENQSDIREAPSIGPSSLPSELPSMSSDKPSLSPSSVPSEYPTDSSEAPSFGPSSLPSELPSMSSDKPSLSPSSVPSESPTDSSEAPSFGPSSHPSDLPSMSSDKPSLSPSSVPSEYPTDSSEAPSFGPSSLPSELPSMSSDKPSLSPSSIPSENLWDSSEAPSSVTPYLPSVLPSMSSDKPSLSPSSVPSESPTDSSEAPSIGPSSLPSELPSMSSDKPSLSPSSVPSENPTDSSEAPSFGPSSLPSELPSMSSDKPSLSPSSVPSESPTDSSEAPSFGPSSLPSELPSMSSDKPSLSPSSVPSENQSDIREAPSIGPSSLPSELPSMSSDKPSLSPSSVPSEYPTDSSEAPSFGPSSLPSELPSMSSDKPSLSPSSVPSESPTDSSEAPSSVTPYLPSVLPSMSSDKPSLSPSSVPSESPTDSSEAPSIGPSSLPSELPSMSSDKPSLSPSSVPSENPTDSSEAPSFGPSSLPSELPSMSSDKPSLSLSSVPSESPTDSSEAPSFGPSSLPSELPSMSSDKPSLSPSSVPSENQSDIREAPSFGPSSLPSELPSMSSDKPSLSPSSVPSEYPTDSSEAPSFGPSSLPSELPSMSSDKPSLSPSSIPSENLWDSSEAPSSVTSYLPSVLPSMSSDKPSLSPSSVPSESPSDSSEAPSFGPSSLPSELPSMSSDKPSLSPSSVPSESPTDSSEAPSSRPSDIPSFSTNPSLIPSSFPSTSFLPTLFDATITEIVISLGGQTTLTQELENSIREGIRTAFAPVNVTSIILEVISSQRRNLLVKKIRFLEVGDFSVQATIESKVSENDATSQTKLNNVASAIEEEAQNNGISVTVAASELPSEAPSLIPSLMPSQSPSKLASATPSNIPSKLPSSLPSLSKFPTKFASNAPSAEHIASENPTEITSGPSSLPSLELSLLPSSQPSTFSSNNPSFEPSLLPSSEPSLSPIDLSSDSPSSKPSIASSDSPSSIPSVSLNEEPFCVDDDSFRLGNRNQRNCAWIGNNPSKRCVKQDSTKNNAFVFQFCPQTCNRCDCANDEWLFKDKANKNCEWVAKRPTRRCDKTGARENCKGVCGGECRKNTDGWVTKSSNFNTKGNCAWFKKRARNRCPKDSESYAKCPNACSGQGVDDALWISSILGVTKDCTWFGEKSSIRCPKDVTSYYYCPIACPV